MLSDEEAIKLAVDKFNSTDNDSGDEVLEFLFNVAYGARDKYIRLYAAMLQRESAKVVDEPFKTVGEFLDEASSS